MSFQLRYSKKAEKQLSKLDTKQSQIIVAWLMKNIDGCDNPRSLGSALTANHKHKWRYRIGDYRVLVDIQDEALIILAIQIGHRRDVY